MFMSDSKLGFRFGREAQPDPEQSPLRAALTAAGRGPAPVPPPLRLTPSPTGPADGEGEPLTLTDLAPAPEAAKAEPAADTPDTQAPTAIQEPRPMQPIIAQARAVLTQPPGEDEARLLDKVMRTINELSTRHAEQEKEVAAARESVARMQAEKVRLAEENQQMRDLLSALLRTVEAERRRRTETLSRIGERLQGMVAEDTAEAKAA